MTDRIGFRWVVLGVSTAVTALAWSVRSTSALFFVEMLIENQRWAVKDSTLGPAD